jgi:PAT family beta-lactamase induction signal transducer AmpG
MTLSPARGAAPRERFDRAVRLIAVTVLGFASGLPLALTGQAMQAWLSADGIDIATIGFLSLVGLPYTFKFLWAPLMDRFEPPWLGRRRGWLVLTQLALAGALSGWRRRRRPPRSPRSPCWPAWWRLLSASQDVVVDAYRTDLLPSAERGIGSSLNVLGYRLAMILSGGIAFIWVDPRQGGGWSWPEVYRTMALYMVFAAAFSALLVPRLVDAAKPVSVARNDLLGFLAVAAAVALGFVVTRYAFSPLARELVLPLFAGSSVAATLQQRWADLVALFAGIAFTLPLVAWAARRARFETLLGGLKSYFAQPGAAPFLAFIVLYKLPDAFAGALPHALPAAGDAVQHRRGRRRQQGDRPVADDPRRAASPAR